MIFCVDKISNVPYNLVSRKFDQYLPFNVKIKKYDSLKKQQPQNKRNAESSIKNC